MSACMLAWRGGGGGGKGVCLRGEGCMHLLLCPPPPPHTHTPPAPCPLQVRGLPVSDARHLVSVCSHNPLVLRLAAGSLAW